MGQLVAAGRSQVCPLREVPIQPRTDPRCGLHRGEQPQVGQPIAQILTQALHPQLRPSVKVTTSVGGSDQFPDRSFGLPCLIGGDPSRALKAKAKIVVFNAAGVGIEGIGITRLPALDKRGVAAVAVDCQTARIGDAASALDTGLISHANQMAMNLAAAQGLALKAWLEACT